MIASRPAITLPCTSLASASDCAKVKTCELDPNKATSALSLEDSCGTPCKHPTMRIRAQRTGNARAKTREGPRRRATSRQTNAEYRRQPACLLGSSGHLSTGVWKRFFIVRGDSGAPSGPSTRARGSRHLQARSANRQTAPGKVQSKRRYSSGGSKSGCLHTWRRRMQ